MRNNRSYCSNREATRAIVAIRSTASYSKRCKSTVSRLSVRRCSMEVAFAAVDLVDLVGELEGFSEGPPWACER